MKTISLLILAFLTFVVLHAQEIGGPYTTDANTVLLMHFDDDLLNSATVGNNGVNHGTGVSYETGVHGQALRLDNSTVDKQSWIEVPFYDELNFNNEFSIECWFKIDSWGENHTKFPVILMKGNDYEVSLNSEIASLGTKLYCRDENFYQRAGCETTDILEPGKWYHIAYYFNFAHKHLYIVLRDESFSEIFAAHDYCYSQPFNSNDKLDIGLNFDGYLDELRFSNKYRNYRDDVLKDIDVSTFKDSVYLQLKDEWGSGQGWPLTAYFPTSNITSEIHKGPSCGMTAIMRLFHYMEYPRFPTGSIDFDNEEYHWLANLDTAEYCFEKMLYSYGANNTKEEYDAAARMALQIGAAAKNYQILQGIAPVKTILERHFHFDKKLKIVYREEYTKEEWVNILKNELNSGRPVLVEGTEERYDNGSWAGHFYLLTGYNRKNQFNTDFSLDSTNYWTDLDDFWYGKHLGALIYAEPDWKGKTLTLDYPKGNEYLQKEIEIEIKWSSTNINSLLLEYSTDGGKNWQVIADNVNATSGKYLWTIPKIVSNEYKVRVSDSSDGNIYKRSETFNVIEQLFLTFEYPKTNTYFQSGITQPIYWESEGLQSIKIDYFDGENWNLLCDSVAANAGVFRCAMPNIENSTTILKATYRLNNDIFSISDTFRILPDPLIGGVYENDSNTILLLHFEEDILNAANNSVIPVERSNPNSIFNTNYDLHLGKAFRINNTMDADDNCLIIQNTEELNPGNNWTIETWVKYNDISTDKTEYPLILDKGESFGIWLDGAGNGFSGYVKFGDMSEVKFFQNQHLDKNKWYHVSMSSNSTTREIYFYVHNEHRQLIFEDSRNFPSGHSGELNQSENDLFIGGVDESSNCQFDGWIDELRITKEPINYSNMITKVNISKDYNNFVCYPNPINEQSCIEFTINNAEHVNLSIYDLQGRKICTLLNNVFSQGKYSIPIKSSLSTAGIYLCKLSTEKGFSTLKLIVE